jgi:hypothetical protein
MSEIDINWVKEQMTAARLKQSVGTSILRLFEVWNTMNHENDTARETVDAFSRLALGHALVDPTPDELKGIWVAAQPGQLKITDIVRVKSDAYDGKLGQMHNGRIGKIVGIRYGDIVVKTIDNKEPQLNGSHYSPHILDKLVQT